MVSRNGTLAGLPRFLIVLLVLFAACKEAKQRGSQKNAENTAQSTFRSRYSFQTHLARGNDAFDVFTEGYGSLRTMTIIHERNNLADTVREEIDGTVVNAACADLDSDSLPEVYVFAQSAGSGSYANLYGFQFHSQFFFRNSTSDSRPDISDMIRFGCKTASSSGCFRCTPREI